MQYNVDSTFIIYRLPTTCSNFWQPYNFVVVFVVDLKVDSYWNKSKVCPSGKLCIRKFIKIRASDTLPRANYS